MSDASEYREYLAALADGVTKATDGDRTASAGSEVLAIAGLIRWSGAPKAPGWTPTASGRQILNHFRRKQ